MSNTSKKHRNKKIWQVVIALLVIILVGSFIISRKDKTVDTASFANVETFADAAHEKGNVESEIRLIEYSDLQCPACKAAVPVVNSLVDAMGDQFVLEYRHFPLVQIHPNATLAAQAAEAAAVQGKFWEMHDMLFDKQSEWSQSFNPEKFFRDYAVAIGINEDRFRFDLESDEIKERVRSDADEAAALQLPGTPGFVYNGEQIDIQTFSTEILDPTQIVPAEESDEVEA